jgi:hypothetical protein
VSLGRTKGAKAYDAARTAAMVAEAQLKQLAVQERQGVLVNRATGERIVYAFARRHRDAWIVWPARIGAELAAVLGVEAAELIPQLEAYVTRQLDELASERFDLDGASVVEDTPAEPAA